MINFKMISLISLGIIITGCSDVKFLGAKHYSNKMIYTERWFVNPDIKISIPSGTEFYGASAEKLKEKFIIKYYISDDKHSLIEIAYKDMWTLKGGDYLYIKTGENLFIKFDERLYLWNVIPVKECYKNGWCQTYPNWYNETLYIKKSSLDKPLSGE
ncbi:MAG: hypothetical protein Q8J85_12925 [Sulfuricurvum sp.]|nr:hypothetical protein [Sulfuricurvum sp.]MDP3023314.1 hypothetical protein [Sulfuricurvum sp.]